MLSVFINSKRFFGWSLGFFTDHIIYKYWSLTDFFSICILFISFSFFIVLRLKALSWIRVEEVYTLGSFFFKNRNSLWFSQFNALLVVTFQVLLLFLCIGWGICHNDWSSEDNFVESVISFYLYVDYREWTQVLWFCVTSNFTFWASLTWTGGLVYLPLLCWDVFLES